MHELSAQLVVGFEDVLGRAGGELVARLEELDGWPARFAALDRFWPARLERAPRPAPDVAWALARLCASGGRIPIAALGASERRLRARVREQVGPAPKTVARLVRLRRAVALLGRDYGRRVAEIAAGCGYDDQAHTSREFRALAGTSPSGFVARLLPDGLGVAAV